MRDVGETVPVGNLRGPDLHDFCGDLLRHPTATTHKMVMVTIGAFPVRGFPVLGAKHVHLACRARYTVASTIRSPSFLRSSWIWLAVRNSSTPARKSRIAERCHVFRDVLVLVIVVFVECVAVAVVHVIDVIAMLDDLDSRRMGE